MARARNIKPGFFTNDDLGDLSPLARLSFIGLWGQADFNGNMKYKPKRLKVEVLPYDNADFAELVNELAAAGFVRIYEVAGERYLHVVNFDRHQRPHKNEVLRGTEIPQPVTDNDLNGTAQKQERTETEQGRDENRSNPPDTGYRIPDTVSPQPDTGEGTSSTPSGDSPTEADADKATREFPLKDGTTYRVSEDFVSELIDAFPNIDVEAELKKARVWLIGSPAKRKTSSGMARFLNTWMSNDKHPSWQSAQIHSISNPHNGFAEKDYNAGTKEAANGDLKF